MIHLFFKTIISLVNNLRNRVSKYAVLFLQDSSETNHYSKVNRIKILKLISITFLYFITRHNACSLYINGVYYYIAYCELIYNNNIILQKTYYVFKFYE